MSDQATLPPPAITKGTVVPYLTLEGAAKAAAFYAKAFGATEVFRYPVDDQGRTMHIHLHLNGGSVMLSDAYPEHGAPAQAPQGFQLQLMFEDGIDAAFQRAVAAGCEAVSPVEKMFWGDRWGQVRDPWGVTWGMNQADS